MLQWTETIKASLRILKKTVSRTSRVDHSVNQSPSQPLPKLGAVRVDAAWKAELAREGQKISPKAPVETWANARQPRGTSMPSGQTVSKVNTVFFEGYVFHTKARTCLS